MSFPLKTLWKKRFLENFPKLTSFRKIITWIDHVRLVGEPSIVSGDGTNRNQATVVHISGFGLQFINPLITYEFEI
jgi:hypothetical protein